MNSFKYHLYFYIYSDEIIEAEGARIIQFSLFLRLAELNLIQSFRIFGFNFLNDPHLSMNMFCQPLCTFPSYGLPKFIDSIQFSALFLYLFVFLLVILKTIYSKQFYYQLILEIWTIQALKHYFFSPNYLKKK